MICAEKCLKLRDGDGKKHKSHHREGERARERERVSNSELRVK